MKTALITGITGQDGSFLAELLLDKGYDVHGTIRRSSTDYRERIAHLEGKPHFHLHYADLGDSMSILQALEKYVLMRFIIWRLRAMCRFHSMLRSSRPTSMLRACCAFLRPYASADLPRPAASIRLRPRSFMARWRRSRRTRKPRSIPTAPMP